MPIERSGATKGRGAVGNVPGRFEKRVREPFDDGWPAAPEDDADRATGVPTVVTPERSRSILSRNDSPDIPFDVSINPYKGCEHGCVYCFARPSHAFLDLSPGIDFETRIFSKPDAPRLLREELGRKGYVPKPIALGANTDPYQPVERRLGITRALLEVLDEHRHPVTVVTKSNLVLRDLDLLAPMARENRAAVYLSVTTLDPSLAGIMEPRATTPARRLDAMGRLHEAGVPTGVLASPMIPFINDAELERILAAAAGAGAASASYILLRLPHELKQIVTDWLRAHFPDRAERVLARLRDMRGGKLYDADFSQRQVGRGGYAELLARRFEIACRRHALVTRGPFLDVSRFRVPPRPGDQPRLFA